MSYNTQDIKRLAKQLSVTEEELFDHVFEHGMQRFDMFGKVTPKEESSLPLMHLFVKRSNKRDVVGWQGRHAPGHSGSPSFPAPWPPLDP